MPHRSRIFPAACRRSAVGGGVDDLIEITGDLTLDGSLEVTDIGGFGAGVYRLVNFRPGDRGEPDAKNASLYASVQGEHTYLDAIASFAW